MRIRLVLKDSQEFLQIFSRLPPLGAIFLSAPPPNLKSWIRPWYTCILNKKFLNIKYNKKTNHDPSLLVCSAEE
jgi:hypothetical protein